MIEKQKKREDRPERAVLVGLITPSQNKEKVTEYLNELQFLVETAGGVAVHRFVQKLNYPNPQTYVGSGKLEEIFQYVKAENIDMVVFDDELGPSQLRNLEKALECKILDRTNLILDIFARRAQTAHAKVQVELAQYQYLLPRLTRMWTHLERQRGGIGLRGPGETEIETDRRIIRDKIALLKKRLKEIDKQKATQRKNRGKLVRVALVGYTNVGKSTIMNLLSKSNILAENKLFATLDTTVRKVVIENLPFLLSDTVGFIRKLPTGLIESFKSTLDEVRESDILIHVADISHPEFEDHIQTVRQTLTEIGAGDKDIIMVFNKIDALREKERQTDESSGQGLSLKELEATWMSRENQPCIFISAKTKENYPEFKKLLYDHIRAVHAVRYPYNNFLY
ncbi:GTPase HflX [Candidatus Sulfidibacterium hydrothermale]|jgi:GTP-binding protein HflX|uniref:GTPase HflX n=1 Tax=Candidatus Sulfidibacterium hydrothermale TaxID=2875962 RepID=UPI001F0A8C47|nr:GTPase HflX [Candidatus Sulfidibacterium hydrothermale]UBM62496.1 GTPase HflX [Candidatus Sulfidibacterium hydrothermale]